MKRLIPKLNMNPGKGKENLLILNLNSFNLQMHETEYQGNFRRLSFGLSSCLFVQKTKKW